MFLTYALLSARFVNFDLRVIYPVICGVTCQLSVGFYPLFGLVDPFGDFDLPGTGLGTFKMIFTGPGPIRVIQLRQPVFKPIVPGIGNKPILLDQRRRTQKIRPKILRMYA